MIWFSGTIRSAIDKVKSSNCLLLVFIEGDDDLSKKYNSFLKQETNFKPENYIAIKISDNSVAFQQFKKIYVTVPVPSVFLIGTNGMPLGIICSREPSDLSAAFSEAFANHKQENAVNNHATENLHAQNNTLPSKNEETCQDYECSLFLREIKKRFEQRRTCPQLSNNEYPCEHTCSIPTLQSARIQFRLPTNEVRSWEFPDMCTLNDVKLYLMETMKLSSGFKLLRTYPRIAFSPQDEEKTLSDLALTPNATLIVVPLQDEALQSKMKRIISKRSIVFSIMTIIFRPIVMFFDYFKKFIKKSTEQGKTAPEKKKWHHSRRLDRSAYGSNVHGFNFDESSDSDADMNTDNGNSTQQK